MVRRPTVVGYPFRGCSHSFSSHPSTPSLTHPALAVQYCSYVANRGQVLVRCYGIARLGGRLNSHWHFMPVTSQLLASQISVPVTASISQW